MLESEVSVTRRHTPSLLLVLFLSGAALAQDAPKPKQPPKPAKRYVLARMSAPTFGDRWRVLINMRSDNVVTLRKGRKPLRVDTKRDGHEVKWVDHLQGSDNDGVKLLRTYELTHDWGTGVVDKEPRKVWFRWDGDKLESQAENEEELSDLAKRYVQNEKESAELEKVGVYDHLFPLQEVPVGHKWTIDPRAVGMIFNILPKDLELKKSRCFGHFTAVRWGKNKKRRFLRIRFDFRLKVKLLHGLTYRKGGVIKLEMSMWLPEGGRSGVVTSKITGSLDGEARSEEWPKGVTAKIETKIEGELREEPLPRKVVR